MGHSGFQGALHKEYGSESCCFGKWQVPDCRWETILLAALSLLVGFIRKTGWILICSSQGIAIMPRILIKQILGMVRTTGPLKGADAKISF
jgi:hypothetical protein